MNFLVELFKQKELTENIFLETIATRICEIKEYDISEIAQIQSALSDLHSKQRKGVYGKDIEMQTTFIDDLRARIDTLSVPGIETDVYASNPRDIFETTLRAIRDSTNTLKKTHHVSDRSNLFDLFNRPGSATYGQELSSFIGQAMRKRHRH